MATKNCQCIQSAEIGASSVEPSSANNDNTMMSNTPSKNHYSALHPFITALLFGFTERFEILINGVNNGTIELFHVKLMNNFLTLEIGY